MLAIEISIRDRGNVMGVSSASIIRCYRHRRIHSMTPCEFQRRQLFAIVPRIAHRGQLKRKKEELRLCPFLLRNRTLDR